MLRVIMREVEIKAKVANKQDLFDRLNQQAISLSQPLTQEDSVYAQIVLDPDHAKNNWLRIRQEGSRHTFTLKYAVNNELDNMEYETEVSNPKQLEQIIFRLGFKKHSEISKVRQQAKYDDITLCIDDVKGLGLFIEAEVLLEDDDSYESAIERMWRVFAKLGIGKDDEVTQGYDVLMNQR